MNSCADFYPAQPLDYARALQKKYVNTEAGY